MILRWAPQLVPERGRGTVDLDDYARGVLAELVQRAGERHREAALAELAYSIALEELQQKRSQPEKDKPAIDLLLATYEL